MKLKLIGSWIVRIVAAAILFQTLYFKFTSQPELVELFTKLGVEPWSRIGPGVIGLITSIFLLIPSTVFVGAFLGVGLMAGAIVSHLSVIVIQSKGDGGQLFMLAVTMLVCCSILLILPKKQVIVLIKHVFKK